MRGGQGSSGGPAWHAIHLHGLQLVDGGSSGRHTAAWYPPVSHTSVSPLMPLRRCSSHLRRQGRAHRWVVASCTELPWRCRLRHVPSGHHVFAHLYMEELSSMTPLEKSRWMSSHTAEGPAQSAAQRRQTSGSVRRCAGGTAAKTWRSAQSTRSSRVAWGGGGARLDLPAIEPWQSTKGSESGTAHFRGVWLGVKNTMAQRGGRWRAVGVGRRVCPAPAVHVS